MKKIAVLAAIAIIFVSSLAFGYCNFSAFTKWNVSGQRDGRNTYDLYYKNDPTMNTRVNQDVVMITLVLNYTDWGIACRIKDTLNFPSNTRVSIESWDINLKTGDIIHRGSRYLDVNCQMISDIPDIHSTWFSPDSNTMGYEYVKIARIIFGTSI